MTDHPVFFFREQPVIETERMRIREIRLDDAEAMFAMDSDAEVHRYLGEGPVGSIAETRAIIEYIRGQYESVGIGRWAAADLATDELIGWTGFKWIDQPEGGHVDYLDLGYRFLRSHWGRGYASETAEACVRFARESPEMEGAPICGMVMIGNVASERVLRKVGMHQTDTFDYAGEPVRFYEF